MPFQRPQHTVIGIEYQTANSETVNACIKDMPLLQIQGSLDGMSVAFVSLLLRNSTGMILQRLARSEGVVRVSCWPAPLLN